MKFWEVESCLDKKLKCEIDSSLLSSQTLASILASVFTLSRLTNNFDIFGSYLCLQHCYILGSL